MARLGGIGSQYFDADGKPLSGGKLYFYETETTTPKTAYSDAAMTIPHTTPVRLDALGTQPNVFLDLPAKMVITDANDVEVLEIDPMSAGVLGATYYDGNGDPLSGGKLYFYESCSLIAKTTYADSGLTIENPNPVILDEDGNQPDIFYDGDARVVLTDSDDVQLRGSDAVVQTSLEPIIECRGYDCAAFETAITDAQMFKMRVYSLLAGIGDHPDPFTDSIFQGRFVDDGSSVGWPSGPVWESIVASGIPLDPCGGTIQRVARWRSAGVSARVAQFEVKDNTTANSIVALIAPNSFSFDGTGNGVLARTGRNYLVTTPFGADDVFRPTAAVELRENSDNLQVRISGDPADWVTLGTMTEVFGGSELILVTASVLVNSPGFIYEDNSPFTNFYKFTHAYSVQVNINGFSYSYADANYETSSGYFDAGQGPPTFTLQPNISTTKPYFFREMRFNLVSFGGADLTALVDVDDFVLAQRRNQTDYAPPGYCDV